MQTKRHRIITTDKNTAMIFENKKKI